MLRHTLLALSLMLTACGPDGTTNISIHDSDGDANISTGLPGIDASIKIPRMNITEANFDVSGVKLYPGSTIKDLNVAAHEGSGDNDGRVAITFESPASLDKVQAWFRDAMAKHHFKVSPQGNGFAGTTDDGQPLTLELEAVGADKTKGSMTVGA